MKLMFFPPWLIILIALLDAIMLLATAGPGLRKVMPYCAAVRPYEFLCVKDPP